MRIFGYYLRFPRWREHAWWRWLLTILGLTGLCVAIWLGGPMTGWGPLTTVWLRATLIGAILGIFLLIVFIRWRRRVRAARAIEEALIPAEPEGDGKVLAEKMQDALGVLKKSGGSASLYDLPWYVIIGPPGAGKTTAIANSGMEFPLAQDRALSGFGGTRNMDFWFAEDAVMIDTAGRYTTQDSDLTADKASWDAFLELLKKTRPNQPINGVILSFSVEDMLNENPETLHRHAETVRARLAELHEQLKIDFPVYVMFTKADLIAGFREYFASFSQNRRKLVWGHTFQTADRKAITHEAVPQEFDRLVARLSDEVADRLSEEPDGISRIAIFGLPGQMALLRDNISDFLRRVFEPTRYKTNAILRGFYFTSGTQEGTPIDQVLGAINSGSDGPSVFQPAFMSGRGKSFFIHDLLKRVIIPEQGWVSHDRKAVRRAMVIRTALLSAIALLTVGTAGALGYSYWQNLRLVRNAEAETAAYARAAVDELNSDVIDDTDLRPIVPLLNDMRAMPAGFGDSANAPITEKVGLGQRDRLNVVATETYSQALERMLRPRLILDLEQRMPQIIGSGEMTQIYRALKVYLLLGMQGETTDDTAIKAWFAESWAEEYPGLEGLNFSDQLEQHLDAMLALDDKRKPLVALDQVTVDRARAAIAQLPLDEQAYALIVDNSINSDLRDWQLTQKIEGDAGSVFATVDGSDLSTLSVPALYTYEGFWGYFFNQLEVVGEQLRRDQWVLGEQAASSDIERRLQRLDRDLMERYRAEFVAAWKVMLGNLTLVSMVADKPQYAALGTASSAQGSPLLRLVEAVDRETYLKREIDEAANVDPTVFGLPAAEGQGEGAAGASGVAGSVATQVQSRMLSRTSGVKRIIGEALTANARKTQVRPSDNPSGGDGAQQGAGGGGVLAPIEAISNEFENWHAMLLPGSDNVRPIDTLLGNLGAIWMNRRDSVSNPGPADAALPTLLSTLTRDNSRLPESLSGMVTRAEDDFRTGASNSTIEEMNRALSDQITFTCRDTIAVSFPFADSPRSLSIDAFSRFFGAGGAMDRYFTEYLDPYVERTDDGLVWRSDKEITQRLSVNTLKQFERAEKIRSAFFAGGGAEPSIEITVAQVDASPTVESALLSINDTLVPTVSGQLPRTVVWPGTGKSTLLQLSPQQADVSQMRFDGSAWTFIEFLNAASTRQQNGDTLRATYTLGGRSITYNFTINAIVNPFTMPELREFECPQSVN
ncbi:type VI secretion system membrane subunit TssM [Paracoccus aurantiacus]|uniref:Type VI secretion system membrane subunit TssM n=1 Tax=Paracoccus aurantiacus TaxID=2599412 RepID=A0A5C6SC58_9RHOB|nr:type VI secretion system membrane subunit TssM [Paracoccus aurantiacus]TXB71185.1 type VI secretion system membrane subunit TssM [Paracoccus aurantiacus]